MRDENTDDLEKVEQEAPYPILDVLFNDGPLDDMRADSIHLSIQGSAPMMAMVAKLLQPMAEGFQMVESERQELMGWATGDGASAVLSNQAARVVGMRAGADVRTNPNT